MPENGQRGLTLLYFKKGAYVKPTMSLCEIIQRCFNLLMRLEVTRWNKTKQLREE